MHTTRLTVHALLHKVILAEVLVREPVRDVQAAVPELGLLVRVLLVAAGAWG